MLCHDLRFADCAGIGVALLAELALSVACGDPHHDRLSEVLPGCEVPDCKLQHRIGSWHLQEPWQWFQDLHEHPRQLKCYRKFLYSCMSSITRFQGLVVPSAGAAYLELISHCPRLLCRPLPLSYCIEATTKIHGGTDAGLAPRGVTCARVRCTLALNTGDRLQNGGRPCGDQQLRRS
jgi:hypothetical protein